MSKEFSYKTVSGTYKLEIHFNVDLYEDREVAIDDIIEGYIAGEIWGEDLKVDSEEIEYIEKDDEEIEEEIIDRLGNKGWAV